MPKIQLKTNSPEFIDRDRATPRPGYRCCAMPGCRAPAEHRAPKDRSLQDYHWFCLTHVQEYNAAWDFFAGMQTIDIERQIIESLYGDRPTWHADSYRGLEAELQRKIHETRFFTESEPAGPNFHAPATGHPEFDALTILGLAQPVAFETIKKRYRELVKQYHPDHNPASPATEDLIKRINMAYTILKMAYSTPATDF